MKKKLLGLTALSLLLVACQTSSSLSSNSSLSSSQTWKVLYDIKPTSPDFIDNVNTCYQIFPYAFADSNGDGIGDINGITAKLDYLATTLGVDCIWLNPIHPSPTYHKYDVVNYYGVDRLFGTLADFQQLITQAENKGIRIVMDLVINHTSSQHPWFINAAIGPSATYHPFYRWASMSDLNNYPSRTGWHLKNGMYYYASFWSEMPELNFDHPPVRLEIKKIMEFWLDQGVAGFRIDAAQHIYDVNEYPQRTPTYNENISYFKEFNYFVKEKNPDAFVVGEVYTANTNFVSKFYQGMDSAFNFDFSSELIMSLQSNNASTLGSILLSSQTAFKLQRDNPLDSMFLTNHDQNRIADQVGFNLAKLKLAAHVSHTVPGITWVYYGEELGMGGSKPDNNIRQPFKWSKEISSYQVTDNLSIGAWGTYNQNLLGVEEQLLEADSLLKMYQQLIALRNTHPALRRGEVSLFSSPRSDVLMYRLTKDSKTLLVIHNFNSNQVEINHQNQIGELIYTTEQEPPTQTKITLSSFSTIIVEVANSVTSFT